MKWSRKQPEKVTPGAQLRVDQFTNWMSSIVELWRYSVDNDTRKCLRKNFPGDNPALLSKVSPTYKDFKPFSTVFKSKSKTDHNS